jgi:hypothetical protein
MKMEQFNLLQSIRDGMKKERFIFMLKLDQWKDYRTLSNRDDVFQALINDLDVSLREYTDDDGIVFPRGGYFYKT